MWEKILSLLNLGLSKLPWNGSKTIRGIVLTVLGVVLRFVLHKEFDPAQLDLVLVLVVNILLNLSDLLQIFGVPLASLGFVHKIVKWLKPDGGGDDDDGGEVKPMPFVRKGAENPKWE